MNNETPTPAVEEPTLSAMDKAWKEFASNPSNLVLSQETTFMHGWIYGKLSLLNNIGRELNTPKKTPTV